jgi:hypothetical protein
MSSTMVVCGRRACTRSIQAPDRSASARRFAFAGQPTRLEATHLAGRSSLTIQSGAIHHGAHRRIVGETLGVVDILIAGEAAEYGLAEQTGQQMAGVLATAALRQRRTGQVGQPERVVEFPVGQQPGVGGDAAAVEFQLQAAVEIDPERPIIRFTCWVFHPRASNPVIAI